MAKDKLLSEERHQLVEACRMASAAYKDQPQLGDNWQLLKLSNEQLAEINSESGFSAKVWFNSEDKKIWVAIAGTDDLNDVAAYSNIFLHKTLNYEQIEDAFKFINNINNYIKTHSEYSTYEVKATGHSFGQFYAQIFSHTFGWQGVGFDGVGAKSFISSGYYKELLAENNIANPKGSNGFINVKFAGEFPCNGLVGNIGTDIKGSRYAHVFTEGMAQCQAINNVNLPNSKLELTKKTGTFFYYGINEHSIDNILNAMERHHFIVDPPGNASPTDFFVKNINLAVEQTASIYDTSRLWLENRKNNVINAVENGKFFVNSLVKELASYSAKGLQVVESSYQIGKDWLVTKVDNINSVIETGIEKVNNTLNTGVTKANNAINELASYSVKGINALFNGGKRWLSNIFSSSKPIDHEVESNKSQQNNSTVITEAAKSEVASAQLSSYQQQVKNIIDKLPAEQLNIIPTKMRDNLLSEQNIAKESFIEVKNNIDQQRYKAEKSSNDDLEKDKKHDNNSLSPVLDF